MFNKKLIKSNSKNYQKSLYYKLIAFDLDGTLLNNKMVISKYSFNGINKIIEKGIKCIVVSSRTLNNILALTKDTPFSYILALDGGIIYNVENNIIEKISYIDNFLIKELINTYNNKKININLYAEYDVYISHFSNTPKTKLYQKSLSPKFISDFSFNKKIIGIHLIIENNELFKNIYKELTIKYKNYLSIKNAGFNFIVINNKNINKGNAIKFVSNILGISLNHTIAIGDSKADIPMIKIAGLGIGMINGDKKLLKYAKEISEKDNNNDGAINFLLKKLNII